MSFSGDGCNPVSTPSMSHCNDAALLTPGRRGAATDRTFLMKTIRTRRPRASALNADTATGETPKIRRMGGYCLMRNDCKLDAWGNHELL